MGGTIIHIIEPLCVLFLFGYVLGEVFKKLRLPALMGMIVAGIILGPVTHHIQAGQGIMTISNDLRRIALVIILTRAGLSLDVQALKRIGRPAVMMCFVPASFEIVGIILLAPPLLNISHIEAGVLGCVMAAVSPAIVVPRMLKLMEKGYGKSKSIPELLIAGSSLDDIFVIVFFTIFLGFNKGGIGNGQKIDTKSLIINIVKIPSSIILGVVMGLLLGYLMYRIFEFYKARNSARVVVMLGIFFGFMALEGIFDDHHVGFSSLLCIMIANMVIGKKCEKEKVKKMNDSFNRLWTGAEIMLFTLVGAGVEFKVAGPKIGFIVILIIGALGFRLLGVSVCLIKTKLNFKERLFCLMSYIPKATVQAALGPIALVMMRGGHNGLVFTVSVLSILITAPLGGILIDLFYKKLLHRDLLQIPGTVQEDGTNGGNTTPDSGTGKQAEAIPEAKPEAKKHSIKGIKGCFAKKK